MIETEKEKKNQRSKWCYHEANYDDHHGTIEKEVENGVLIW